MISLGIFCLIAVLLLWGKSEKYLTYNLNIGNVACMITNVLVIVVLYIFGEIYLMPRINKSTRLKEIAELIDQRKYVSVAELANLYDVSEMSIRTDLKELQESGEIIRCHGGAKRIEKPDDGGSILIRKNNNLSKKICIGKVAASLINDGDSIMLDSGTTVEQIAYHIDEDYHLTVITNAINVLNILMTHPNISVYVPNGKIDMNAYSIVGEPAEKSLAGYFAKIAFISVGGVSSRGLGNNSHEAANIAKIFLANSQKRVLVADSSKVNQGGIFNICSISEINTFITDSGIDRDFCAELEALGVEVLIAEEVLGIEPKP